MHRMTDDEKAAVGGKLARAMGLKLDEKSMLYVFDGRPVSALGLFNAVHDICCERCRDSEVSSVLMAAEMEVKRLRGLGWTREDFARSLAEELNRKGE